MLPCMPWGLIILLDRMSDSLQSDVASLFGRFFNAGWLVRPVNVGERGVADFTPIGLQRIDAMVENLRDLRASGIVPTSLAAGELGGIFTELMPPNFSQSEFIALLRMIDSFGQR